MNEREQAQMEVLLAQVDTLHEVVSKTKEAHLFEKVSFEQFKKDLVSWLNFWGSHARAALVSPDIANKDMILFNIAESFEKTIPELKVPDEKEIQNESEGDVHHPGRCLCG